MISVTNWILVLQIRNLKSKNLHEVLDTTKFLEVEVFFFCLSILSKIISTASLLNFKGTFVEINLWQNLIYIVCIILIKATLVIINSVWGKF